MERVSGVVMAQRDPPREYLWAMLKWRGPSSMPRGRSVRVPAELTTLCRIEQVRRMRQIALEAKPNAAWQLIAYEIEGQERVTLPFQTDPLALKLSL
jgi:hypothetical protein